MPSSATGGVGGRRGAGRRRRCGCACRHAGGERAQGAGPGPARLAGPSPGPPTRGADEQVEGAGAEAAQDA